MMFFASKFMELGIVVKQKPKSSPGFKKNESAGEAVHADFDKFYQGFIVKDLNSAFYNSKLLKAVKLYNVSHI